MEYTNLSRKIKKPNKKKTHTNKTNKQQQQQQQNSYSQYLIADQKLNNMLWNLMCIKVNRSIQCPSSILISMT